MSRTIGLEHDFVERYEVYEAAEVYDFAFSRTLDAELSFFQDLAKRYGVPANGAVIDFGCGCGDWAIGLSNLGYSVTAVDSSEHMLAVARSKPGASSVIFRICDIASGLAALPYDAFDAAFCLTGTIHHLVSPSALENHLIQAAGRLAPNGLYIMDLHISGVLSDIDVLEQEWSVCQAEDALMVDFVSAGIELEPSVFRSWVELTVQGTFDGRRVFLRNSHWFSVVTAVRLLSSAQEAGFELVGWFSSDANVRSRVFKPHLHPSVYCVLRKASPRSPQRLY